MSTTATPSAVHEITDGQRVTRETLLAKITAQSDALIVDVTGGPRAHEVALTLVQLAAGYAAIIGSENQ
jgi:acetyl-CoA carboxylase beta subunit